MTPLTLAPLYGVTENKAPISLTSVRLLLLFGLLQAQMVTAPRLLPPIDAHPQPSFDKSPANTAQDLHPFRRGMTLTIQNESPTCVPYYEFACGSPVRERPGGRRNPSPNNQACIPRQWRCDGIADCENESDEFERCEAEIKSRQFSSRLWGFFFVKCFLAIGVNVIGQVRKSIRGFT